ncbi:unnamed protein product [Hymenolepis diminuta]|uniref:Uncharacterized protein n=1 Tax=Hymenolepis diminuta TaxID=6216 RepID=A0A564YJ83_HYMDI|nr:unnamed protein product [Hymenolepis diminuta]
MDSIKIAKIKAIVRTIMGQLKLSKPDRAPENYIKNVGEFHHESSGLRPACYAEILLKLLSVLDKNPDVIQHNLVDE